MIDEPMVEAHSISKRYQRRSGESVDALSNVSVTAQRGELVTLIGPTGCGKSTLLHILGGMREPDSGSVVVDGTEIHGPQPEKLAFVFQDYALFPWRTVLGNAEIGLRFRGVAKEQRRAIALECLRRVGLGSVAMSKPGELSGGMRQRVAIARALTMQPKLLLMDEPFGALDEQTRITLGMDLLDMVASDDLTMVFVTHSLSEAVYLSDRIFVMGADPGRIVRVLDVPEGRPRGMSFMTSKLFNDLRSSLFEELRGAGALQRVGDKGREEEVDEEDGDRALDGTGI